MKRNLPPMNSLVVFEQAARSKCFKHAADNIGISKSAVSKQISKLEKTLDISLFQRHKSGNELTQAGSDYSDLISQALDIIEFATETTIGKSGQHILICETPVTFGEWWLTPALVTYRNLYPNVFPKLVTPEHPTRANNGKTDLSIICHQEPSHESSFEPLFNENLVLVANHDYLIKDDQIKLSEPFTLIGRHDRKHTLNDVLSKITDLSSDNTNYIEYQHFYMVKSAVENGIGIGLLPDYLCYEDIKKGNLINIMGYQCESGFTYSVRIKEHKRVCKKVQRFLSWLKQITLSCNSLTTKDSKFLV